MGDVNRTKAREEQSRFTDIDQILGTAARLFRRSGYHGTSMQDIADEVGILKGSLYHHINSKEELLLMLLRASVDDVLQSVRTAARAGTNPREKLRNVIRAELAAMARHQDEILIWLMERDRMRDTLSDIGSRAHSVDQVLQRIIQEGINAGVWQKSKYPVSFYAIRGMITAFPAWYKATGPLSIETIADEFSKYIERILS